MIDAGNELSLKASRDELVSVYKKMEDLENRSKRNNIITWGLKEGVEEQTAHNFLEDNRESKQIATAGADTAAGNKFPQKWDTAHVRRLHPAVA